MSKQSTQWMFAVVVGLFIAGCAGNDSKTPEVGELSAGPEDPEAGKSFFLPTDDFAMGKADDLQGKPGLRVAVDNSRTAVWEVTNQWTDTDTANARLAGIAWDENSGQNWNEKYAAWVRFIGKKAAKSSYNT